MSASAGSRKQVLESIRRATGGGAQDVAASYARLQRGYVRNGQLGVEEKLALMVERLREYDAEVVETTPDVLSQAIANLIAASGRQVFVAPPGLPDAWP